ncbi:MAG: hypothetical protein AAB955_02520 [Patescibacteria group bacterium]
MEEHKKAERMVDIAADIITLNEDIPPQIARIRAVNIVGEVFAKNGGKISVAAVVAAAVGLPYVL